MSPTEISSHQEAHYRPLDRTLAGETMAGTTNDLLCLPMEATRAAVHTAVQTPINSLTQMIAPQYLPNVHIIEAPEQVAELSPRWHAQQLGSALGAAADMVAIECLTKGALPPAVVGACYDGLLRPVDSTRCHNQVGERLKNAAIGAVGFGTLYGSARALGALGEGIENATWKALLANTTVKTAIAGIPAGLATTALSGGSTLHDYVIGSYTSAFTGMGLGAIHASGERQAAVKIREQQQAQRMAQLEAESCTDPLTGLGNRRSCDAALKNGFERSTRTDKPISLICGDLDGFKKVNDELGHHVGDQVLVEVGRRLKEQLRSYDHAARPGGDEFVLVLPDTDLATAQNLAARLGSEIKLNIGESGQSHSVGISLGVVTRRQGEERLEDFQIRADREMYRIKNERHNQFNL